MNENQTFLPRLIAWELTRACPLHCKHCRAAATDQASADELSTAEAFTLLDNIASFARPIIILTGGEPMLRADVYDIATYARGLDLPVVMAPCGMLLDEPAAARIVQAGIHCVSLSLDGATAPTHDEFRAMPGSFDSVLRAAGVCRSANLDFQINTTVSRHNIAELPQILELAIAIGASVFNPFLLVPTGRGRELADQELSPAEYEKTLRWLAGQQRRTDIRLRVTCAPHYQRILRQDRGEGVPPAAKHAKGCMGGQSFAFISHVGKVQICGFLDLECGDVRREELDFRRVWETSEVFRKLRDPQQYGGRCGRCEYQSVCGGCRARAFAATGDYLAEEPFCAYIPAPPKKLPQSRRDRRERHEELVSSSPASAPLRPSRCSFEASIATPQSAIGDPLDESILSIIQHEFPVAHRPFDALGEKLGVPGPNVLHRVQSMVDGGVIRRLGAIFDSQKLGYCSTLVAARAPAERLEALAAMASALPGVTHNYRRDHAYNLWFTLTCPSQEAIERTLAALQRASGVESIHLLPALAVYKLQAEFAVGESVEVHMPTEQQRRHGTLKAVHFDDHQKDLVRAMQESLLLVEEPYAQVAEEIGWTEANVLAQVREWLEAGVIRRIGAIVYHRRLGFEANGMAVFAVEPERIDEVGRELAKRREVSHCYRRPAMPDWPYNLFAMVHGHTEGKVRQVVEEFATCQNLPQHEILFSTHEYKKTSMKYFVEPQG